jgi:hypothetical protein
MILAVYVCLLVCICALFTSSQAAHQACCTSRIMSHALHRCCAMLFNGVLTCLVNARCWCCGHVFVTPAQALCWQRWQRQCRPSAPCESTLGRWKACLLCMVTVLCLTPTALSCFSQRDLEHLLVCSAVCRARLHVEGDWHHHISGSVNLAKFAANVRAAAVTFAFCLVRM